MNKSVLKQITDLQNMTVEELRPVWRTLFGTEPPAYNRAYLVKRLAYRVQELAYGGLSNNALKTMDDILDTHGFDENGGIPNARKSRNLGSKENSPVVGTRLIREWHGNTYEVTVVRGGFEYQGVRFRTLTHIAKLITGDHRSGVAFFGLNRDKKKGSAAK
ncbi:MAG: DUF2924 domain-containing protein [Candidatus Marsarchaeota archaeon]|nr:DUF2924 domain-containing protein [Candidatus Marsarchaeota archaeon]